MHGTRRLLSRVAGLRVHPSLHSATQEPAFAHLASPNPPANTAISFSLAISESLSTYATASTLSDGYGPGSSSCLTSNPGSNPVLQRYALLVESGSLQQDAQQLALVQDLARLYDEILLYKARMDEYHRATAEHQARRLKRLQELLAEEAAAEARQQQQQREEEENRRQQSKAAGAGSAAPFVLSSLSSWLKAALVGGSAAGSGAGSAGGAAGRDSPLARARRAAAAREERLQREIGPPPAAPEPPKGMYVWGSVGSGKSMLVALFYQALVETAQLPATRWMHFNAAMLEVHSRLHHLDSERWRQRDERERLHHQHRMQQQQQQQAAQPEAVQAAQGGQAQKQEGEGEGDEDEDEDAVEADAVAAGGPPDRDTDLPVPEHLQGVFRHWDPRRDPEVQRQKEAKAAMLAVRRHMRLARLGRNDPRTLAAANAPGLVRMAASFIRGRAGDPRSGWGAGSGPVASVLYFDEVQVTDVFSAVALKGMVEALTSAGCVLVCTSNRSPRELPRHGLHEDMWEHFVETLLQRCTVHELSAAADYRRVLLEQGRASIAAAAASGSDISSSSASGGSGSSGSGTPLWPPLACSYILPAGPSGRAQLERLWQARAEGAGGGGAPGSRATGTGWESVAAGAPLTVPVLFGRQLEVRRSSRCGGAAWFSFSELCGRPLGPADYVALSQRFHTVFLEGIPAMSMQVRDQARRFITLVDELYNSRCVLVASAEVPPEELFTGAEGQEPILDLEGLQFETAVEGARLRRDVMSGGGVAPVAASPVALAAAMGTLGGAEERFAFRRAVSRLLEMQSPQYILGALRMRQQQQA